MSDIGSDIKKNVAKTGIASGSAMVGAAVFGPIGAVGGAVIGTTAGTLIDHGNGKRNVGACRAIEDVRKLTVERLPPDRAIPVIIQLDDLSEIVGCVKRVRRY